MNDFEKHLQEAEQGDISAMHQIIKYYLGENTKDASKQAKKWLERAANLGSLTAAYTLVRIKQVEAGVMNCVKIKKQWEDRLTDCKQDQAALQEEVASTKKPFLFRHSRAYQNTKLAQSIKQQEVDIVCSGSQYNLMLCNYFEENYDPILSEFKSSRVLREKILYGLAILRTFGFSYRYDFEELGEDLSLIEWHSEYASSAKSFAEECVFCEAAVVLSIMRRERIGFDSRETYDSYNVEHARGILHFVRTYVRNDVNKEILDDCLSHYVEMWPGKSTRYKYIVQV